MWSPRGREGSSQCCSTSVVAGESRLDMSEKDWDDGLQNSGVARMHSVLGKRSGGRPVVELWVSAEDKRKRIGVE